MPHEQERTVTIEVEGMTCQHCVGRVQKALNAIPGVSEASIDLAAGTASVHILDDVGAAALIAAVEQAGYKARAA